MCVKYQSNVLFPRVWLVKTWLSLTEGTPNYKQGCKVEKNVTGAKSLPRDSTSLIMITYSYNLNRELIMKKI